jgi:16S rRNA (guanine527-N7)-methyltransferase
METQAPLVTLLEQYLPGQLTPSQVALLVQAEVLYHEWNAKINLISRTDIDHLAERHLLHSLLMLRFARLPAGAQVLDIGTGGGLPGLPLAIAHPEVQFTLLDSTRKKLTAVQGIADTLGLQNVRTVWQRAEEHTQQYDYVTGRAVTAIPAFWQLAGPRIRTRKSPHLNPGVLYLTGEDQAQDAALTGQAITITYLGRDWLPEFPWYAGKVLVYIDACNKA